MNRFCKVWFCLMTGAIIFCAGLRNVAAVESDSRKSITIKMATLAPKGSPWHEILKDMATEWKEMSQGDVLLKIYPGGVAGDESDMIRKMRIGQIHAGAITNAGLSKIATEVTVLTIPMAVDSWDGLDRVRTVMTPRIEATLLEKGFIVLNWGDAGWVRFFVPVNTASLDEVRRNSKLVVWGQSETNEIWKAVGFQVVPLAATDMLTGLQTGMINAFNTTPIMALASQWFPFCESMIDLPWAPLIGATVISKKMWEKVPEKYQPQLLEIAKKTGNRLQQEIRKMEADAIAEMEKRGLRIVKPDAQQLAEWQALMKSVYPKIRGQIVPEDWFDDALRAASGKTSATNGQ